MRIAVIIPSVEQKEQAGIRIRYQRIASILNSKGGALDLISIQDMTDLNHYEYDLYIISKCYDVRSVILAQALSERREKVCVDIFDDYFSQNRDSRFIRLRYWLKKILKYCCFVLCSTVAISEVVTKYGFNIPVHIYNDPVDEFSIELLCVNLDKKFFKLRETKKLNVAWFGIGDNPDFSVGLQDLVAYSYELSLLSKYEYVVKLFILTNLRSLTSENLHKLSNISIPYQIEEWTIERERSLLGDCYISFLPVNAQNFSRVKSLNRALTSLTHGTQVFSVGFPLYEPLNEFIYRNADCVINDIRGEAPSLRRATSSNFFQLIETLGSANVEIERLMEFTNRIQCIFDQQSLKLAIIHGKESTAEVHKFSQRHGCLSVGSPFANIKLNYDVRFIFSDDFELIILINSKIKELVKEEFIKEFIQYRQILNSDYMYAKVSSLIKDFSSVGAFSIKDSSISSHLAIYSHIMSDVSNIIELLFPNFKCLFSEQTKRMAWSVSN